MHKWREWQKSPTEQKNSSTPCGSRFWEVVLSSVRACGQRSGASVDEKRSRLHQQAEGILSGHDRMVLAEVQLGMHRPTPLGVSACIFKLPQADCSRVWSAHTHTSSSVLKNNKAPFYSAHKGAGPETYASSRSQMMVDRGWRSQGGGLPAWQSRRGHRNGFRSAPWSPCWRRSCPSRLSTFLCRRLWTGWRMCSRSSTTPCPSRSSMCPRSRAQFNLLVQSSPPRRWRSSWRKCRGCPQTNRETRTHKKVFSCVFFNFRETHLGRIVEARHSRRRTAMERRQQRQRALARHVGWLLQQFKELGHTGARATGLLEFVGVAPAGEAPAGRTPDDGTTDSTAELA